MPTPARPIDILNMDAQSSHIVGSLATATKCVQRLVREGFTVLSVHVGCRNPVIVIQPSPRCERLRGGVAMIASTARGRKQLMATSFEGCEVMWNVKGGV